MKKITVVFIFSLLALTSCVSKKDYEALNAQYEKSQSALTECKSNLMKCRSEKDANVSKINMLREQITLHKQNIEQLQSALDRCVNMSQQGNVNISKLLDEINAANKYIRKLTEINRKNDSLNIVLSNKFKRSLEDLNDEDVDVKVLKGVVFVSLSDKMLFKSGSYTINENAHRVLSKISKIVNDYKDYDILIEGHTDNVPVSMNCIRDNWDLSALRATAIARYMQNELGVDPARITAGARSEYVPKASNDTEEGRSINRRTEIIVMPKLDEFLKLMGEKPKYE